jgi:hypothetical protein
MCTITQNHITSQTKRSPFLPGIYHACPGHPPRNERRERPGHFIDKIEAGRNSSQYQRQPIAKTNKKKDVEDTESVKEEARSARSMCLPSDKENPSPPPAQSEYLHTTCTLLREQEKKNKRKLLRI